jgi:predicted enzyme related to lactoylglutathione lyase
MPEINKYKPGTFCWPELATSDTKAAKKFYTEIFGWNTEDGEIAPGMVYTMATLNGKSIGALYALTGEMKGMNIPPHWLQYVSVDNADATTAKAKTLGGAVLREPMDVMDIGRMAVLRDPTGATFAVWQPKTAIGAGLVNEHGAITWNELLTNNVDRAGKFYTDLFGWGSDTQDMGHMMYTTFINGERPAAGMMAITKEMGEVPSNWMQYFAVDACDKAAATIKHLGGGILAGPQDIPEIGRFAVAHDPQGAAFAVIELLKPPTA